MCGSGCISVEAKKRLLAADASSVADAMSVLRISSGSGSGSGSGAHVEDIQVSLENTLPAGAGADVGAGHSEVAEGVESKSGGTDTVA